MFDKICQCLWIWTGVFWNRKRPLYQLCPNPSLLAEKTIEAHDEGLKKAKINKKEAAIGPLLKKEGKVR